MDESLDLNRKRARVKLIRVRRRSVSLVMTLVITEFKSPPARVMKIPKAPIPNSSGHSLAATQAEAAALADRESKAQAAAEGAAKRQKERAMRQNKKIQLLELMKRPQGATLSQLMELIGWRKPTLRAFVRSLERKGEKVESEKSAVGEWTYRIVK